MTRRQNMVGGISMSASNENEGLLNQADVMRLFLYDPFSGELRWIEGQCKGKIAGKKTAKGYLRVTVGHKTYAVHRIIWIYSTGRWPIATIDHIDRDPANNRLSNLREATLAQNLAYRRYDNKMSMLPKGVTRAREKFRASIWKDGKRINLGVFDTPNNASLAYREAAVKIYGEFAQA